MKTQVRLVAYVILALALAAAFAPRVHAQYADQRQWAPATAMGGTPNAQTIALPNYNLNVGAVVRFLPTQSNTGSMTLSINNGTPKAVVRPTATGILPTGGGELVPGQMAQVVYDGTQFQLSSNPLAGTGTVTSVTCGSGLAGGTITSVGTCSLAAGAVTGVAQGGTGQTTFALNLPLIGNGVSPLIQGSLSGNTTKFATTAGTLNSTDCVEIDVNGNLVDAGGPCTTGGGGGTVTPGPANGIAYYPSAGTTLSGTVSANNAVLTTGPTGVPSLATTLPAGFAVPWTNVTATPTTLAGYGVSTVPWTTITGAPSTLAGYGIASPLPPAQGGTGVANTGTLTLGANLATTGAGASTLAFPPTGRIFTFPNASTSLLATNGAAVSATASNPANTNSLTVVMMGIGTSCAFTPANSTRVRVSVNGVITNNTAGDGAAVRILYGTGTPPANGAASTGTTVGAAATLNTSPAGLQVPVAPQAIITGLTPGTTYWFDLGLNAVTGGTAGVSNISCTASEV